MAEEEGPPAKRQRQEQEQEQQQREAVVIISGSRGWVDKKMVHDELARCQREAGPDRRMVLVHGACWQGVDSIAAQWAKVQRWRVVSCPPDWKRLGRSAGIRRNASMIKEWGPRAHTMLAFCLADSPGTTHAISQMKLYDPDLKRTRIYYHT